MEGGRRREPGGPAADRALRSAREGRWASCGLRGLGGGRRCSWGTEKGLEAGREAPKGSPPHAVTSACPSPAIRCPRPQDFENGEYWPRAAYYNLSDEISFQCYDGYTLRGSANRTCQVTGRWDGQTAICDNGGEKMAPPRWPVPASATARGTLVTPGRCIARRASGLTRGLMPLQRGTAPTQASPLAQGRWAASTALKTASPTTAAGDSPCAAPSGEPARKVALGVEQSLLAKVTLDPCPPSGQVWFSALSPRARALPPPVPNLPVQLTAEPFPLWKPAARIWPLCCGPSLTSDLLSDLPQTPSCTTPLRRWPKPSCLP